MGRYVNKIRDKNQAFDLLLGSSPSNILSGGIYEQQTKDSQDWSLGQNSPYALASQSDRPDNPIKDVYNTYTGQKVGAYNTQTGVKYYQIATPNSTAEIVKRNNQIVEYPNASQTTEAVINAEPKYKLTNPTPSYNTPNGQTTYIDPDEVGKINSIINKNNNDTSIGTTVGAGIGGTSGVIIGGGLGSLLGPIGTAAGGVIGTGLGAGIGGSIGYTFDAIRNQDYFDSQKR